MNIALFGGTFDPIHTGHLQAARAAARRFRLRKVLFVPSGTPPHKQRHRLTSFYHRFAMVALACQGEPRFVPSLLEAPRADGRPHYSVDTVRAAQRLLAPGNHLYFLIGFDAFLDLPHWKDYRRLLALTDFIVVSRPGFGTEEIRQVVPPDLLSRTQNARNKIALKRTNLFVMAGLEVAVASREIREAVARGRPVAGLVPPLVEEYIWKEGLYHPARVGTAL